MENKYKIAFVGWNSFQFIYVKNLIKQIPNSIFLVIKKIDNNETFFTKKVIENDNNIKFISIKEIEEIDKQYDIIIAQTPFYGIEKIKNAKLVFLQYGYAKEPYNFGEWRALSDLTLVYGEYAKRKVEEYTPADCVGNPRFDKLKNKNFYKKCKQKYSNFLDSSKLTILYTPTWGDLSSFDLYIDSILKLKEEFNLLIKLHHNTEILESKRLKILQKNNIQFFGKDDDILELIIISDIVISDYSGAIFDAFYCKKPLILLNIPKKKLYKSKKINFNSIEFSKRYILGEEVNEPKELKTKIIKVTYQKFTKKQIELRNNLFLEANSVSENIINSLNNLMNGKYIKTKEQKYYHSKVLNEFYSYKKNIKEMLKNIYFYFKGKIRKI